MSALILTVDTPEIVDPNTPVQPYEPQASQFAKRELKGERVELELDQERSPVRAPTRFRASI